MSFIMVFICFSFVILRIYESTNTLELEKTSSSILATWESVVRQEGQLSSVRVVTDPGFVLQASIEFLERWDGLCTSFQMSF